MSISFSRKNNQVREPLLKLNRIKFKSERNSLLENVETNVLKIDFTRLLNELNSIDLQIDEKISYFITDVADYTLEAKNDDGVKYTYEDIEIYIDDDSAVQVPLQIDSVEKISGQLSRLFYKTKLLESNNWYGWWN